jgi:phosphatidylglycerophosphate synthase
MNFVQVDAQKMNRLSGSLPSVMMLPVILIVCFVALFYYLSWTFFFGFAIFGIAVLVNLSLSRCMS